jgi:hypothetical protein
VEGLLSLSLSLNGDPIDPEVLDNFAYEVHQRHRRARPGQPGQPGRAASRPAGAEALATAETGA